MSIRLGQVLDRGSRSVVHAWGRAAVAKVPVPSTPDAWIEYEARYTAAVRDVGAPVPRFLGLERIAGRTVAIYERIHGRSMWEQMVHRPSSIPSLARTLAELQVQLFTLVPSVALPLHRDRLTCKIARAAERFEPSLADALDAVPAPGPLRLCHGDLHPGNVLLGTSGPVLIDWFDASRGEAEADIARTSLLLSPGAAGCEPPRHLPGGSPPMIAELRDAYRAAIAELHGADAEAVGRWEAVLAVARLAEGVPVDELLAIWQGWRRRPAAALGRAG